MGAEQFGRHYKRRKERIVGSIRLYRDAIIRMRSMGMVCRNGREAIQEDT